MRRICASGAYDATRRGLTGTRVRARRRPPAGDRARRRSAGRRQASSRRGDGAVEHAGASSAPGVGRGRPARRGHRVTGTRRPTSTTCASSARRQTPAIIAGLGQRCPPSFDHGRARAARCTARHGPRRSARPSRRRRCHRAAAAAPELRSALGAARLDGDLGHRRARLPRPAPSSTVAARSRSAARRSQLGPPVLERDAFKAGAVVACTGADRRRHGAATAARRRRAAADPVRRRRRQERRRTIVPRRGRRPGSFCQLVRSRWTLDEPARRSTPRLAVLLGNVAAASHGETVRDEVARRRRRVGAVPALRAQEEAAHLRRRRGAGGVVAASAARSNGVRWREVPGSTASAADAAGLRDRARPTTARAVVAVRRRRDGRAAADRARQHRARPTASGSGSPGACRRRRADARCSTGRRAAGRHQPARRRRRRRPGDARATARENAPAHRAHVRPRRLAARLRGPRARSGEVAKAQATWVWDGLAARSTSPSPAQAGGVFAPTGPAPRSARRSTPRATRTTALLLANYVPGAVVRARRSGSTPTRYVADDVLAGGAPAAARRAVVRRARLGAAGRTSATSTASPGRPRRRRGRRRRAAAQAPATATGRPSTRLAAARRRRRCRAAASRVFPARPDPRAAGRVLPGRAAPCVEDADART